MATPSTFVSLSALLSLLLSPLVDAAEAQVKLVKGRPSSGPIRLLDGDNGPRLVTATMHGNIAAMTATVVESDGKPLLTATWPAVAITAWDVVRHGKGVAGAFVVALGGTNPVVMSVDGVMSRVSEKGGASNWDSYRFPRFVERNGGMDTSLSAVGERKLVLFSDGKRHDLIDTDCGMVVRDGTGLAVLYTTPVPGAGRPYHLHYARLDEHFRMGTPTEPFGDTVIHEFDVATSTDHTAVLASTDSGLALSVGESGVEPTFVHSGFLSSPSVLISKNTIVVAAIQDGVVVTATLPLATTLVVVGKVLDVGQPNPDAAGQTYFDRARLRVIRTLSGTAKPGQEIVFVYTRETIPHPEPPLVAGGTFVFYLTHDASGYRATRITAPGDASPSK